MFLFVVLPALFAACLFVPASLNVLRYVFIGLCVAGVGLLWYRQLLSSTPRIALTAGYVIACVIVLGLVMQGGTRDLQQPGTEVMSGSLQGNVEQTQNAQGAAAMLPEESTTPEPEPTPTVAPISDAEIRLNAFMTNWAGGRVEDMVRLVQPSWASAQDNPSNRLFVLLSNRTPLEFTIEEISGSDNDTSRTVTMTANIYKNNGKDPSLYRFMVLMVKEGGEWYVDPNSIATNDEIATTEDSTVVNDSKSTGAENWTIAPRQTVSPAPPGSTTLYFNPDGGNYYHMDQYCPSIKEEYLPLTGSFAYSELGGQNLLPCLRCGAPTQTLPPDSGM
ncbi:MAG: hypothetical protein E7319_03705 [Clostridiales bacterium]|nr:hypothetical protein [Clostridiales bacterium]